MTEVRFLYACSQRDGSNCGEFHAFQTDALFEITGNIAQVQMLRTSVQYPNYTIGDWYPDGVGLLTVKTQYGYTNYSIQQAVRVPVYGNSKLWRFYFRLNSL